MTQPDLLAKIPYEGGQMEITLHGNHPAEVVFNEVLARLFKKHGKRVSMS
jgi:hypothetical protein